MKASLSFRIYPLNGDSSPHIYSILVYSFFPVLTSRGICEQSSSIAAGAVAQTVNLLYNFNEVLNTMKKRPAASGAHAGASTQSRVRQAHLRLKRLVNITKLVFFGLLLVSAVLLMLHLFVEKPDEAQLAALKSQGVFLDGITINGVDVSGMTRAQANVAVQAELDAALSSINITVRHGTAFWVLTAADMAPSSTLEEVLDEAILLGKTGTLIQNSALASEIKENGKAYFVCLVPDRETLLARLAVIGAAVDTAPVEPSAIPVTTTDSPAFTYTEGSDGYILNQDALFEEILTLMAQGEYSATLTPELEYASPMRTVEELKQVTQYRAEYQTSFGGSSAARNENRVGNIQKATTLLNGAKVEPGEEFNFNAFIGPRTEEGGWPLAPGIVSGERYEDEPGGGICQVSTTLYCALLRANASMQRGSTLEEILAQGIEGISITERRHHSWPSSYVDKGLDSTVTGTVESGKSLNFVNNTSAPLYIFAYCDQEEYTMTVYIYGEPLPEGVTYEVRGVVDAEIDPGEPIITEEPTWPLGYEEVTVQERTGYQVTAYRDLYRDGVLESTETLYSETYNAVTEKKTVGTGDPSLPQPGSTGS